MRKKYINPYCNIYLYNATNVLNESNYNSEFDYDGVEWS